VTTPQLETDIALELLATITWRQGTDGPEVERIEVKGCTLIPTAAAELALIERLRPADATLQ
jgi:hypothetical protein